MPNVAARSMLAGFVVASFAILVAAPGAAAPVPLGPETIVDENAHHCPVLAAHEDGSFAVAWMTHPRPGENGVAIRAGSLDGSLGPKREAGVESGYAHDIVRIAATPAGYTATWTARPDSYSSALALYADRDGTPLGPPFYFARPYVEVTSPRPVGGFVSFGGVSRRRAMRMQLLDGSGAPSGDVVELRYRDSYPGDVVHRSDGQFVLWWQQIDLHFPPTDRGDFARRFDAGGNPVGEAFPLVPAGRRRWGHFLRAVAIAENGTLAVVWLKQPWSNRRGRRSLWLRVFAADGMPLGPPRQVEEADTDPATGSQLLPTGLAVDDQGRALLAWMSYNPNRDFVRTQALAFGPAGGPADGDPFPLAMTPSGERATIFCAPAVAVGDVWLVAWWDRDLSPGSRTNRILLRQFAR